MFDFSWSEHTLGNVLFCTIAYAFFIIFFFNRNVNKVQSPSAKIDYKLLVSTLLLIITACVDTDWFHYREMVHEYDFTFGAINYGEPIYRGIVLLVDKNYLLFRIIVWGGAFLMALSTFRRFEINPNTAIFFIGAVFLIKFNYSRATLGMASYYLALSFLLMSSRRHALLNYLFAAVFLWGAYEFHHSMLLLILLTPIVVVPMDKPVLAVLVLLALPIIASVLNSNLILIDRLENEYISDKMNSYLVREGSASNFFGIIQSVIGYGAFIIPIVVDSVVITKNHEKIRTPMLKLYRIMISTVILAVAFLLMNLDSSLFVYRILYMTFIPLTILTVYLFEQQLLSRKCYKFIVGWGVFAISYVLLHLLYKYF